MMEYQNFITELSIVNLETLRLANLIIEMVESVFDENEKWEIERNFLFRWLHIKCLLNKIINFKYHLTSMNN